jgi:hypothetical protein
MKIFIIFAIFIFPIFYLFPQDIVISDTNPPNEIKGSLYFPLSVGSKWTWTISDNNSKSTLSWEIVSYKIISEKNNNLKNIPAFEIISKEMNNKWYFFEYDGFICSLESGGKEYILTRIFPINPQLEDTWSENNDNYKISEIKDNYVKAEYENEADSRFGYVVFNKNVGLFEIYQNSKKGNTKNVLKFSLTDYFINNDFTSKIQPENLKKQDKINLQVNPKKNTQTSKSLKVIDNFILTSLKTNKSYIQVASYNFLENAQSDLYSIKNCGYDVFIFKDKDGYYKILIETSENEKIILSKVKKDFKDAFIKQRKK